MMLVELVKLREEVLTYLDATEETKRRRVRFLENIQTFNFNSRLNPAPPEAVRRTTMNLRSFSSEV